MADTPIPRDDRSAQFSGMSHVVLTEMAAQWPTSGVTPEPVAELLEKARRQFALSGVEYTQLVTAFSTCLHACELLLRSHLPTDKTKDRRMFSELIDTANKEGQLTEWQYEWLKNFALRFRNRLAHPKDDWGLPPGPAAELLNGCHRFIAEYADQHGAPAVRPS
jgi:hypothetical protein